jgi:dienelactone hydrolase
MSFEDQDVVLTNGLRGETLRIPTANPTNFYQTITQPELVSPAEIVAKLFVPESTKPVPVVIVVPGSLGVAPSHLAKAEYLTDAGIAGCVIDPFGERGVTSTVSNQTQYSFAASAWDVLATMRELANRSDLDATRIGAQGHSRGGSAVLSAACVTRLVDLGTVATLRGIYAAYPWSGQQFLNPDVGATIVRAVIGELDEWCSLQQVQAHIHAIALCGGDASWRIFEGAHHSFDRDTPLELVEDASVAPGAPTSYLQADGAFIHPLTNTADPSLSDRDLMLYAVKSGHGKKGAHIGSSGDQSQLFHQDMMDFWTTVMGV